MSFPYLGAKYLKTHKRLEDFLRFAHLVDERGFGVDEVFRYNKFLLHLQCYLPTMASINFQKSIRITVIQ